MPATAVHQISPFQPDEDFINKSLLASLDAQADAEPTSNADDPDQIIQASYPSTSNSSSSGSPSVNFPMSHQVHLPRSESPSDAHKQQMQTLRQDSFYTHPPGLYTGPETFHRQPEFSDEYDAFPNNYRHTFTSYPNTTRSRQQANVNTPYRDPTQYFSSPGSEMYGPSTSQPLLQSAFDSRPPYDYTNGHAGGPHKSYPVDQFNVASSLLHGQVKQAQQPSLSSYSSSVPPSNAVQLSSQTPFGPHVLSMGSTSIVANGTGAPSVSGHGSSVNNHAGGEEISTIFVVGFPEDMQEREFVNMFTFSEGFEAATLKIPNKEYPQYPPAGAPPSATLANGLRGLGFPPYGPQSDPYSLAGVDGRDGVLGAAWHGSDERSSSQHFVAAGGLGGINGLNVAGMIGSNSTSVPPRKQIIGFAKFKTRKDALIARDQLQGKRVDIEKGAVLKAEMAKKNLHTKRGVGSVAVPPMVSGAGVGLLQNAGSIPSQQPLLNGLDSFTTELKARDAARLGGWRDSITLQNTSQQSNDLGNGSTSLGSLCNGPVSREEEEDRRRESLVTTLGGISLSGSSSTPTLRGPREEERIKESQREKELSLLKFRATNTVAFDPFYSVGVNLNAPSSGSVSGVATPSSVFSSGIGASTMSRQTSSGQGTNSGNSILATTTTPTSAPTDGSFGEGSPMLSGAEVSQLKKKEEVVGPWDNLGVPVTFQAISRPRSETQGSSSPMLGQANDTPQNGMNALGHIGSLLNGSIGLGSNLNGKSEHPRLANGGLVSSSSTGSNGSTGNTSPTLPSPASGMSLGSNSSSSGSSGTSAGTTGATRGSVDQNPPINTLYVGNLPTSPPPVGYPADYLEETLKEIFSQQRGYRQLSFRQKAAGPMCFVEFEDVHHAAQAKLELSGNTLGGLVKNGIRLSYSKNPLGVRSSTHVANGSLHHQPQSFSQSFSNPQGASFQQQHQGGDGLQARLPDEYISAGGVQHQQQHDRGGATQSPSILRRGESMIATQGPPLHQSFGLGVGAGNGNGNPNTFLSSPPPRFYSTSPGGVPFASSMTTPLTSASSAFVPRSTAITAVSTGGSGASPSGQHANGAFASSPSNLSPFNVAFANSESSFHSVPAAIPPEQQALSDD